MADETPKQKSHLLRYVVVGLIVVGLIAAVKFLPVAQWLKQINEWVAAHGAVGAIAFVAIYALAVILFVPGSLLTLGAGLVFGVVRGVILVSLGATLGAVGAFLIARYLLRERLLERMLKNPKGKAIDEAVAREGWKMILLLRLSPLIPFSVSNYVYGLTAIRFWPYLISSWIGMLPGTLLYVYLGAAGRAGAGSAARGPSNPWEQVLFWGGLAATLVVSIWVGRIAKKALKQSSVS